MPAAWIRARRKHLSLSQTALAIRVGVTQAQVSQWETSRSVPSTQHMARLTDVLGPIGAAATSLEPAGDDFRTDVGALPARSAGDETYRGGSVAVPVAAAGGFAHLWDPSGHRDVVRVVEETATQVSVELFLSPVGPRIEQRTVPRGHIEPLPEGLPEQTLVYRRDGSAWRLGRTDSHEVAPAALVGHGIVSAEPHYAVGFPNGAKSFAPRSELFVRRQRETDDPTELLASQITESPFFADARRVLAEFVASQRAAFRGVTALAGAVIDLHPHQLATVSRVLLDPVQRYLLADEVGLGKTIEAGLLIRQYLLDQEHQAKVLILVPAHLVSQWREELRDKFSISDNPSVVVESFEALDRAQMETPGLLVVDEAHHSANWAKRTPRRYERLSELAKESPRVLLLSGTPVLHHEDGFLAMLHLLDPGAYSMTDLGGFQRLVLGRRQVADALGNLFEDSPNAFVRRAAETMNATFPDDARLCAYARSVVDALGSPSDQARRDHAIREMRSYLVERYRLDRRLLRTHRDHPSVHGLLPQRGGFVEIPCDEDPWRKTGSEWVADWRDSVPRPEGETHAQLAYIFARFVEASISHPLRLITAFDARRQELVLGATPAFDHEAQWLTDASSALTKTPERDRREAALAAYLNEQGAFRRAVVFIDDSEVADSVLQCLARYLARPERLLRLGRYAEGVVERFWATADAVLVCDRRSEDGVNLQRKPVSVIFYDFPLDPGRLEQRLGRIDRLDGIAKLTILGMAPVGEYECAWVALVCGAVRLFERTVAPLQYVLSDSIKSLQASLLAEGPGAFAALAEAFTQPDTGLDAQLVRLRRQELLDAPERDEDEERAFVAGIERAREEAETEAGPALDGWLAAIQFRPQSRNPDPRVRYFYERRDRRTLVPLQQWLPEFLNCVDREQTNRHRVCFGPFVFRADECEEGDQLLQFGHRFFDRAVEHMEQDDRGKSWGIWRRTDLEGFDEPAAFLSFEFVIEADVAELQEAWSQHGTPMSLRRRADRTFPPKHRVVWFASNGDRIADEALLAELSAPYRADSRGGTDLNLRPERWALAEPRMSVIDWQGTVLEIRRRAEQSIREEAEFIRACRRAADECQSTGARTIATLEARAHLGTSTERDAADRATFAERELTEAMVTGALRPRFRVRSAGAVILCRTPLSAGEGI